MIKIEFKKIIEEMESDLTKFSERHDFEKKLSGLKEDNFKEIGYEIDFLNFDIRNGKLISLSEVGCNYHNIDKFDNNCINYLESRFKNTLNNILKNMYLIILLNLKDKSQTIRYINESLKLINNYFTRNIVDELLIDLFITTCMKCLELNYKKDDIKSYILDHVKNKNNWDYKIISLVNFMLSKKKLFKKDDFEEIEDICWNFVNESNNALLDFLEIGLKISNKRQKNKYDWNNKIGGAYEKIANERENFLVQDYFLTKSINYYKNANNTDKVNELSLKLKKVQNKYEPPSFSLKILYIESVINTCINDIYEKIPLDSNRLLNI